MRLIDLVKKYKGAVTFDVNSIVDDSHEDVVVFMNDEVNAIKDEIVNSEVIRYTVAATSASVPVIKVLVRQPEQTPPVPPETTPGEDEEKTQE